MKKLLIAATLFAMPAYAQGVPEQSEIPASMPEHVQQSIAQLRAHGDRFEKAIAAIEAQWILPQWSDCDQETQAEAPGS